MTPESMEGLGAKGLKTKLIINYLPQTMTDPEFRSMFSSIGELESCRIIRDKATNYSFGYGFVDYAHPEDAEAAIMKLDGYKTQNKSLRVAFSKPPGSSKNVNLYISGLTDSVDEKKLEELFGAYGDLVHTRVLRNQDGTSKSVGFVLFKEKAHAEAAIRALQGYADGYGLNLQIKYAKDAIDQQRTHPKYQEYIHRKFMEQNQQIFSTSNTTTYTADHAATTVYQDPYGGGYAAPQIDYGLGVDGGQKSMRGRYITTRYNPIARPITTAQGMGMGLTNVGPAVQEMPGNVLFCYNIGPAATDADLYSLFSKYGRITKVNVIDGKGYGFVYMPIPYEANEAMMALNGAYYNGKNLQVSIKQQKFT
jgi:ELAV like protein 2/3/4